MASTVNSAIPLPRKMREQWKISDCLSIGHDSEVYLLTKTEGQERAVLKIFQKGRFSAKKYKQISGLPDRYLVLPGEHHRVSGAHYVIYPELTTLREILAGSGISLQDLLLLGVHLIRAAMTLYEHHIYEADISPGNIYQGKEGGFLLGDIGLQSSAAKGTPGYMAPELSEQKIKLSDKDSFDRAMQYSICRILDSILHLNKAAMPDGPVSDNLPPEQPAPGRSVSDGLASLLDRGTSPQPGQRFPSLSALEQELQNLKKQAETDGRFERFQAGEADHSLFYRKTVSAPSSRKELLYPVIWGILILAGCILLVVVYRDIRPDSPPAQKGIYQSQAAETAAPASASNELDCRKKNLTSLAALSGQTERPEEIEYLYAGENQLTDTQSIRQFPKIRELYLDSNRLEALSGICALADLEILVLSYNALTDLPDLSQLAHLRHLDLSSNPDMKDAETLETLTGLTTLNIAGTAVTPEQYQRLCRKLPGCMVIY